MSMHQTPMRLPPNLPIMAQHSAHRLRIHTTVCAASRFAILTATSCSSGDQGSGALDFECYLPVGVCHASEMEGEDDSDHI